MNSLRVVPSTADRLRSLERIIEHGINTFVQVGNALREIQESALYTASHESFQTYCEDRWRIGRAHAYRLIRSARVYGIASPIGDIPNEAIARELAPLIGEPEKLRSLWHRITTTKPNATALDVRALVAAKVRREKPAQSLRPTNTKKAAEPWWFDPGERTPEVVPRIPSPLELLDDDLLAIADGTGKGSEQRRRDVPFRRLAQFTKFARLLQHGVGEPLTMSAPELLANGHFTADELSGFVHGFATYIDSIRVAIAKHYGAIPPPAHFMEPDEDIDTAPSITEADDAA